MSIVASCVAAGYPGRAEVLSNVDLTLEPGDRVALVGPNGSGKSTLLRLLAGVHAPSAGTLKLGGAIVGDIHARDRARRIALLPQDLVDPASLTALDTVLLGRTPHVGTFGLMGSADDKHAREALDAMGIASLTDRPISSCSGGERQRVHFARVLVQNTDVLLLDEPTSAQDFAGARLMLDAIEHRTGKGAIVVAAIHDLNLALRHFPRVLLMHRGTIRFDGTPAGLASSEAFAEAYGDAVEITRTNEGGLVAVMAR